MNLGLSKLGIHFNYYTDEVIILWPYYWHCNNGKIYWLLSSTFNSCFYSFKRYRQTLLEFLELARRRKMIKKAKKAYINQLTSATKEAIKGEGYKLFFFGD